MRRDYIVRQYSNNSHITADILSAIYIITNEVNGKFYIGSATNYKTRWSCHINLLENNKHFNKNLQRSWNKYGANKFKFGVILSVIDKSYLKTVEQYYLTYYFKYFKSRLYNINDTVEFHFAAPNIKGVLNPRSKLKNEEVRSIRKQFAEMEKRVGVKYQILAEKFSVSKLTISRIIRNKLWRHI